MKYLALVLFISSNAFAVSEQDCKTLNKQFVKEHVTSYGSLIDAHCRTKPQPPTKEERVARLNKIKSERPDLAQSVDKKLAEIK